MDSDIELRLHTNLATTHSYYDQAVAVSQKIINDDFEALFAVYPEMTKLLFEDPMVGSISGVLLAPRILLGGGEGADLNISQCLYQMRFQTGKLLNTTYKIDIDLAGWELAVKVDLGKQSVKVDKDADADTQAEQQKWVDFMNSRFTIPGDYSIERLMAKISDSEWNDFDYNNSTFGKNDDGSKRSWAQFKKKYKQMELRLPLMLKQWASDQEDRGLTTLGVKFTLPEATKIDPLAPTFKPTAMYHQVFPYINAKKGVKTAVASYGPPGDSNALLYCEMVLQHELPRDKQLASTGVFTTQAATSGGPRIDGTFALSHQLFLETYLLPKLQVFNQTTDIVPGGGSTNFDNGGNIIYFSYVVGFDDKHPNSSDAVYKFVPDNKVDPTMYSFSKKNPASLPGQPVKNPNNNIWLGQESMGECSSTFKWVPNTGKFTFSGVTTYSYDSGWYDHAGLDNPYSWGRQTWRAEWSFNINILSAAAGTLTFGVEAGPNSDGNLSVTIPRNDRRGTDPLTPDQDSRIQSELTTRLKGQISWLTKELQAAFDGAGKFVYPGNGTFSFENPIIGYTGELLAEIKYLPPKKDSGKIAVPLPGGRKPEPPKTFDTTKISVGVPSSVPDAHLKWAPGKQLKSAAASQPSVMLIIGKNEGSSDVKLKNVTFDFDSVESGGSAMVLPTLEQGPTSAESTLNASGAKFDAKTVNVFEGILPAGAGKFDVTCDRDPPDGVNANATYELHITAVDPYITIKPGESISLAVRGKAGVPGTYVVNVKEQWEKKDMTSKDFWGSLVEPVSIVVSP